MARKANVFIGGSTEGLSIAQIIQDKLNSIEQISAVIWNNGIFEFNITFLESLTHASYSYDFGILIATKDDLALIRENLKDIPRDNVIFEYGLFLGSMGNSRTLLLQEEGVNLPSDLQGYTTPRFKKNFTDDDWSELANELGSYIVNQYQKSTIRALPSTSLAIGYFDSFLKRISRYICEKDGAVLNKNQFTHTEVKIRVIVPDSLSSDIGAKAKVLFATNSYEPDEIGNVGRPFPIKFFRKADDLVIVDMPTTLNAIRPSIELLMPKSEIGKDDIQLLTERKELENFKKTLEYLVSQDDYSNSIVEIIWESELR